MRAKSQAAKTFIVDESFLPDKTKNISFGLGDGDVHVSTVKCPPSALKDVRGIFFEAWRDGIIGGW